MEHKRQHNEASFRCSLWMDPYSVNIFSELGHFIPFFMGKGVNYVNSIPGWAVNESPGKSAYSIYYLPDEESSLVFDYKNRTLYALGKPEDYEDGQALAYLGFWLLEVQRQADSMYTVHSSALTVDGRGILVLGHSGAGKTSILLGLCQKYDCEVISNDLTIVDHEPASNSLSLIDGTKEIWLRLTTVEANFTHLKDLFADQSQSSWNIKTAVMPREIGIRVPHGTRDLDSIFEVHLDSKGKDELLVRKENGIAIKYRLYEDLSRIVRGSAISVFGKSNNFLGYIPSLDSQELHNRRVDCIETMINEVGITSVSGGTLDQIVTAIWKISRQLQSN